VNGVVAWITFRQLLGRRRTLLLVGLGALMVLVALLYRLSAPPADEAETFTIQLLANFGIAALLPLVALMIGTGAFGAEIDEGTIVHLLAKPLSRWQIVTTKLLVAVALIALLTVPPTAITALVAGGRDGVTLAVGFGAGMLLGSAVYATVFVLLGLLTTRAFVVGLAYVFIWEGYVATLLPGTRTLSVRQHALAVVDAIADVGPILGTVIDLGSAAIVAAIAVVVLTAAAVRSLGGFEIRGETA
jgi:ABC-2 type transport system permease protein